ncbi:2-amino-4-hydroxy-6-hydroxymethyldihydropteridine diphosphokinase [Dehalobacterium formicoaceticum]|uniref:2-amino-4-hydroxy-6-hydroxymethyldihydropteridine diphosphokinase n=1 Tax=Dehalobacterium formicoaceticum TaxID=51515 RepID=A0ABT1Y343_9FIRM|nr:2-amino-4-hydroxy-6-hydroxymethyldihydropteridine diphosphokinase [Dehalobacterium formicoaceticum]MCR6545298.1 2-amino-4-hydroxy-6-hydroxymethyldihydropteridine diphosphokinase [Dehalobacterium formicoaceticum]
MTENIAYLSLGSNLGNREDYLKQALDFLKEVPGIKVTGKSSLYQTDPVGYTEQDCFLNAVVSISTTLSPQELLKKTQEIERLLGRERIIHWGPRTMDIDILLFNEEVLQEPDLIIPHPEMSHRRFVLVPLAELDQGLMIPGVGPVDRTLESCEDSGMVSLFKKSNKW